MSTEQIDAAMHEKRIIFPINDRFKMLFGGVVLQLAYTVYSFFDQFQYKPLIHRFDQGDVGATYELIAKSQQSNPLNLFFGLLVIVGIVFICMWCYRASQNVHEAGMLDLNYSPGWNVGWFFIPIAHVIMPVLAVKETVKATMSINDNSNYSSWQNNSTSIIFKIWTVSYVIRMALMYVSVFYIVSLVQKSAAGNPEATIDMLRFGLSLSYITVPLYLLEGVSLLLIARDVTKAQNNYITN